MDYKDKIENVYKDDLYYPTTGRKVHQIISLCLSELFGTFFLMLFGCFAWVAVVEVYGFMISPFPTLLVLSLTWGFSYGGLYVCMAHVSGLFLNPALTITMVVMGEMSIYRMLMYIVCELAGAISALYFILGTTGPLVKADFCLVKPTQGLSLLSALIYECIGTYVLSMLFTACHDVRTRSTFDFSPVKLGFSFTGLHISLYRYTGCSLNPARSLSTSIVANEYATLWVYLVGQLIGAILAPLTYMLFFNSSILEPSQEGGEEA